MDGGAYPHFVENLRFPLQKHQQSGDRLLLAMRLERRPDEYPLVTFLGLRKRLVQLSQGGLGQAMPQNPQALAAASLDDRRDQQSVQPALSTVLSHLGQQLLNVGISGIGTERDATLFQAGEHPGQMTALLAR